MRRANDTPMNYTVVIQAANHGSVVCVADEPSDAATVDAPMTLAALAELAGFPQSQLSVLVRDGMVYAPAADKGRRRAVPVPEVRRVLLVVERARGLDIPPTVLFRALHAGEAALLPDGRIALGPAVRPSDQEGQLVA